MDLAYKAKLLLSSIGGTAGMSIFSYLVSVLKQEEFVEPETLAEMIERLMPQLNMREARVSAWSLHFITGLVFCLALIRSKKKKPKLGLMKGLLFGAVCGMIGILVWNTLYNLHRDPPERDMRKFSGHLLLAHLVYGAVTAMGYRFLSKEEQLTEAVNKES